MTTTHTLPRARRKRCSGVDCGRDIVIVPLDTGKDMPIDPEPNSEGRVVLLPDGRGHVLTKAERAAALERGDAIYQSHFVDCPNGPQFRAKQRSRP